MLIITRDGIPGNLVKRQLARITDAIVSAIVSVTPTRVYTYVYICVCAYAYTCVRTHAYAYAYARLVQTKRNRA